MKLLLAAGIGKEMRGIREAAPGFRQHDLARAARKAGLAWTSATVAAIESGRRDLRLDELRLLARVLHHLDGRQHAVELRADEAGVTVKLDGRESWKQDHAPWHDEALRGMRENERALQIWPQAKRADLLAAHATASGDAEQKAARRFGVSALAVALAARRLWKKSLTEERDERIASAGHAAADRSRAVQTARGHVTRQLLAELGPDLQRPALSRPRRRRTARV